MTIRGEPGTEQTPEEVEVLTITLTWLGVLLIIPVLACVAKAGTLGVADFFSAVWSVRSRSAYGLTFGTSSSGCNAGCDFRHTARLGARALPISRAAGEWQTVGACVRTGTRCDCEFC